MKHTPLTPELAAYAQDISLREHPTLRALREATDHMQLAPMRSSPMQVQFIQFLIQSHRAKRILELGTYVGYSTLGMALALPEEGELITCDINANWTQHGIPFWEEAKQSHKIKLKLGPALETLATLPTSAPFDLIFIDADKTNYVAYYEYALKLISPHGLILIDNIFWDGKVVLPEEKGAQTREIRRLNEKIKNDKRIDCALLTLGDGVFLIRLKEP